MSAGKFCLLINCFIACACSAADTYSDPFFVPDAGAISSPVAADADQPATKPTITSAAVSGGAVTAEPQVDEISESSAYPRLSHRQWALAAQSLLGLKEPPDVSHFSTDPATGTCLENTGDKLEVAPNLWSDYQTASEAVAAQVAAEPETLARLGRAHAGRRPEALDRSARRACIPQAADSGRAGRLPTALSCSE